MSFFDIVAMITAGKGSRELAQSAALDQEMLNRRVRNEARMQQIKEEMGTKYILHPSHMKSRLDEPRPV